MPVEIQLNPGTVARLQAALHDPSYKEAIENSAHYNTRLCVERKLRQPFLDQQTGVAQSDCNLWMQRWQRMPGQTDGQIYNYPAKRWRKKRRQYLMNDRYLSRRPSSLDNPDSEMHQISVVENSAARVEDGETEKIAEDSKDSWYKDYDDSLDLQDTIEFDDGDSDFDDYEEYSSKKKKKRKMSNRGRRREKIEYTDAEKPYVCELCGARYKTRPGLSYHYSHSHNSSSSNTSTTNTTSSTSSTNTATGGATSVSSLPPINLQNPSVVLEPCDEESYVPPSHSSMAQSSSSNAASAQSSSSANDDALAGLKKFQDSFLTFLKTTDNDTTTTTSSTNKTATKSASQQQEVSAVSPSPYCDFCLGDNAENKKTKQSEALVSCADCGRSAHPTCLQFTDNMTKSVKKYRWQCIECKSCGLCGTSDNDDQLLFCDDCDRGYHMYCLTPPLQEPPEGSWSCHLCIEEYGKK